MDNLEKLPRWHNELSIFNRIKPQIIIEGNIMDRYVYPEDNDYQDKGAIVNLRDYLYAFFKNLGYRHVVFYDHITGFYNDCATDNPNAVSEFAELVSADAENGRIPALFSGRGARATQYIDLALGQQAEPTAVIMDFASRYIVAPNQIQPEDVESFTRLQKAVMNSREVVTENGTHLRNTVVLLTQKVNDLPAWFYLDNPLSKTIRITPPTREERFNFIDTQFRSFFDRDIYQSDIVRYQDESGLEELKKIKEKFTGITEGITYTTLNDLRILCKNRKFRISELNRVVDLYRYGVKDNPWENLHYEDFDKAEDEFRKRVQGQDYAIARTLDVVKRAVTGMNGLQHSSHTKPKGVLFFAGPTGTGKTETAKTLSQKIFGDESRCIRFDMSEFSQSHSDQRLLGAPPGYVGYETGGQLTNAVKNNPFSILLFDEIEKAHPSVLDKFLQILEDGRMTDGQGNTVYFSECIIIFTSNLGIYVENENHERIQNVKPDDSYEEIRTKVISAIENFFKFKLNRPEILNRIGENIVVFDFIRPETADRITDSLLNKIKRELLETKNITITFSDEAVRTIKTAAAGNLENGGRGIGNIIEEYLINPLSRYMFDNRIRKDETIRVNGVICSSNRISLDCTLQKEADS